jgi:hypothetical protein
LFMHFLGASRDGLVARRVDLDTISSSGQSQSKFASHYARGTQGVGECRWT